MLRSAMLSAAVKFALTSGHGVLGPKASAAGSDSVEFANSSQLLPPCTSGPTARKPVHSGAASQAAAHCRATWPLVLVLAVALSAAAVVLLTGTSLSNEPMGL